MKAKLFYVSFFVIATGMGVGCGNPSEDSSPATPSVASAPGAQGNVVNSAGFFVSVTNNTVSTIMHVDDGALGTTNFSTPCKIADGAAVGTDYICDLEIPELDLFFTQLEFQIHVPNDMCNYLLERSYYFYDYQPGVGPTTVSYRLNANGTVTDVANSVAGIPVCLYDYTKETPIPGPNCCVGDYNLLVAVESTDNPGTYNTSSSQGHWGGNASNCLAGPGMVDNHQLSANGFPTDLIYYINGTGYNSIYQVKAPIDYSFNGIQASGNEVAANFYNPADHGAGAPLPLRSQVATGITFLPSPYYEWQCLDRHKDINARIRLNIREWSTGTIVSGGNPDVTGAEPVYGTPKNDFADWKDFGVTFPKSTF